MEATNLVVEDFKKALLQIDRINAAEIFENVYLKNQCFEDLEHLTVNALEKIGDGWEDGLVSLSQVYMSGIICEELIEKHIKYDALSYNNNIKIAIGVLQDHHALGKRIVYSVLKTGGYKIIVGGAPFRLDSNLWKKVEADFDGKNGSKVLKIINDYLKGLTIQFDPELVEKFIEVIRIS
ncbi:MAG: hypothetical protein ACQERL_08740 [Bacillota bacterium]